MIENHPGRRLYTNWSKDNPIRSLNRNNVIPIARIPEIHELNIGHSLIADAVFDGLSDAVREIKHRMLAARAMV